MVRVAVLDRERCINNEGCNFVCGNVCPVNRAGKDCIVLDDSKMPVISEELCIGCNICVVKCPVSCIFIENLVQELKEEPIHRYGENSFRVYRVPLVKPNSVVGLIGQNGVGKSSILKILSGVLVPNLGDWKSKGSLDKVVEFFRGKSFQQHFLSIKSGLRISYKPQNIVDIPKFFSGSVRSLLLKCSSSEVVEKLAFDLNISSVLDRDISVLSGGELQRVAIASALLKDADFYAFDEPASYLDVGERLVVAKLIKQLAESGKSVVVIEHDLAILDYLSDYVHLLYGKKGVYGIVSLPKVAKLGINEFLEGYVKDENVRFRQNSLAFSVRPPVDFKKKKVLFSYPSFKKSFSDFGLEVKSGEIHESEVIGVLGPNGIGKTTFVRLLAGVEKPDNIDLGLKLRVSYKPQYLVAPNLLVSDFLSSQSLNFNVFKNEVDRRLDISSLGNRLMTELSGGELQKVAVGVALSRSDCDVVLLDEPTAFVDLEDRLEIAHAIRSITDSLKLVTIVVDHDLLFLDYVSDRLIVFEGKPSSFGVANSPMEMRDGMNYFLKNMQVTFRRDHETGRPRINKPGSRLDQEQKAKGQYYYVD
ncbi:MAG: ribosome biogenesis/translation initiation ATPase RLI [Candidatus Diapherotrites archaeon]